MINVRLHWDIGKFVGERRVTGIRSRRPEPSKKCLLFKQKKLYVVSQKRCCLGRFRVWLRTCLKDE